MKRFITLLLMVTTLLTFTQKVMAGAPLLESDMSSQGHSMQPCEMEQMNTDSITCISEMVGMENCQNGCEMMSVVSVLHFIEDSQALSFSVTQLNYTRLTTPATYHYSETLYRPPFIS